MSESQHPLTLIARGLVHFAQQLLAGDVSSSVALPLAPPFSNMSRENWLRALDLWLAHGVELVALQATRTCPACGGDRSRPLFTSYDGYAFADCLTCGTWFVPRVVDGTLFDRFFERCPDARDLARVMTADRMEESRTAYDRKHFGELLDELLFVLSPRAHAETPYLDIGCGVGHALVAGGERGLRCTGLEVDAECFAQGAAQGLDIRDASLGLPRGPFMIVSAFETLEHVADPFGVLTGAKSVLAPGGLLSVVVPNQAAPSVRILREDCSVVHGGMNCAGHINLFNPESLRALLERAGFAVLDVDGHFSDNPFELAAHLIGSTRSAYDMVIRRREHFYLPASLHALFNATWPVVTQIERASHTAPVLRVIACRSEDATKFDGPIAELRSRRQQQIESELVRFASAHVDTPSDAQLNVDVSERASSEFEWYAIPALTEWVPSPGVSAQGAAITGMEWQGEDSRYGYQLQSPRMPVHRHQVALLFQPIAVLQGSLAIGVLDERDQWLVPPETAAALIEFSTGDNDFVRVVIANSQAEPAAPVATRFLLHSGFYRLDKGTRAEAGVQRVRDVWGGTAGFAARYRAQVVALSEGSPVDPGRIALLDQLEEPYRTECLLVVAGQSELDVKKLLELRYTDPSYRGRCLAILATRPEIPLTTLSRIGQFAEPFRSQCLSLLVANPALDIDTLSSLAGWTDPLRTRAALAVVHQPPLAIDSERLGAFCQQRPDVEGHADAFFASVLGASQPVFDDERHLRAALEWLARSRDATATPGFSASYTFAHGWLPPYPETTGYIIGSLWDAAHELGDEALRASARGAADWELQIQMESGAIQAGYLGDDPQGFWKGAPIPAAFNTGQVVMGWNRTYQETGERRYLDASIRACRFLETCIDEHGIFRGGLSPGPTNPTRSYYTRVAYAMAWTAQLSDIAAFEVAARRHLDWVLSQQQVDGWIANASFLEDEMPLTHTMAYTSEGLLLAGELLRDARYIAASERHARGTMQACERRGFVLPARFSPGWKSSDTFSCVPGNAQFAVLWLQHGRRLEDLTMINTGLKMVDWLKQRQSLSNPCEGIHGGLAGAWPIDGGYSVYSYVNWAAKYFVDALIAARRIKRAWRDAA